jgi:hypothetical protein
MRWGNWVGLVAMAGLMGGCATVTRGTTSQVTIDSVPPGAEARTSTGHSCPETPCTIEISRKSEFTVSYSKPGFQDTQIPVSTRIAGAGAAGFAGNVLIGGLVGMGVDAATGSTLEHYPNPVIATLVPNARIEPGAAGRRISRRPRTPLRQPTS